MSTITIAGGVYRERCSWPDWDMPFGSGGRAAAAVCGLVDDVKLVSYASDAAAGDFSHYRQVIKDFLDKQIARDDKFFASLDKRSDEIKALAKKRK